MGDRGSDGLEGQRQPGEAQETGHRAFDLRRHSLVILYEGNPEQWRAKQERWTEVVLMSDSEEVSSLDTWEMKATKTSLHLLSPKATSRPPPSSTPGQIQTRSYSARSRSPTRTAQFKGYAKGRVSLFTLVNLRLILLHRAGDYYLWWGIYLNII